MRSRMELSGAPVSMFRISYAMCQEFVEAAEDIVAQHHRDFQVGRQAADFRGAGDGVDAAGIGDHLDIALFAARRAMRAIRGGKSRA